MKSHQNYSQRTHPSTPLDSKLMLWCVLYYLGHLVPLGYLTKLGAKRADVVQKFVPCSRVGMFRNERTRSTLLDPYLMFRCVLFYLGAFGTVCCVTTLSSCHEVASEFFGTNAPDPPHWTLNSCFGVFCTIWVHLIPFGYHTKLGAKWAEVVQNFVP